MKIWVRSLRDQNEFGTIIDPILLKETYFEFENYPEMKKIEMEDERFNLTSVIVHSGDVNSGHYVCYKCVNGLWFLTNDSCVYEVQEKDVFKCQAYILFYEKL